RRQTQQERSPAFRPRDLGLPLSQELRCHTADARRGPPLVGQPKQGLLLVQARLLDLDVPLSSFVFVLRSRLTVGGDGGLEGAFGKLQIVKENDLVAAANVGPRGHALEGDLHLLAALDKLPYQWELIERGE